MSDPLGKYGDDDFNDFTWNDQKHHHNYKHEDRINLH